MDNEISEEDIALWESVLSTREHATRKHAHIMVSTAKGKSPLLGKLCQTDQDEATELIRKGMIIDTTYAVCEDSMGYLNKEEQENEFIRMG